MVLALKGAGIKDEMIVVICSREGEKEIDFSNTRHGVWASLVRYFLSLSAEHSYLEFYQKELHAGNYLIGVVVADNDQKKEVAGIMQDNGGERITYFGAWIIEEIANKPNTQRVPTDFDVWWSIHSRPRFNVLRTLHGARFRGSD
ncbi:MAG: hypothetical protein IPG58_17745 [Acidobacteria bacterium]|nr:hypothetical protein [Acidobacteriota bacterium]